MNKVQSVSIRKVLQVNTGDFSAMIYDESISLSHRPVVVKKIIVSAISDHQLLTFKSVGGYLGYNGKSLYIDPENNGGAVIGTYVFDNNKVHEVSLYMQNETYFPLQVFATGNNPAAVPTHIDACVYIEFEAL